MTDNIINPSENADFPKIIQIPPQVRVDPRQIMRILGPDAFRLTPATLAVRMSHGKWQAARHLQYLSTTLATELTKGNARLIISMPPRHGKSKLGSVRTPVWLYDRNPSHQIGICSYGADLATGFSEEVRDIIEEDNDEQDGEHLLRVKLKTSKVNNWSTTEGGRMYAVGVGGTLYGRGVHDLLVDDYYKNPEEASSQAYRDKVYDWFSVIAATRIEPGGSIIIIATRWDPDDLSGRLLSMPNSPWREIRIPGIAEEDDPLGREVGEALWPERYDVDALESWRATMGGYYFDAIVQQKPRRSRSSLFKENWLKILQERPRGSQWMALRVWDSAATEDGGDYTVGLLFLVNIITKQIVIADVIRVQMSPGKVEELIKMTAEMDGKDTSIVFAQEPGSSGKSIVYQYTKMLVGYKAEGIKETGSKFVRAQPFFGACEHGDVYLVKGNWNRAFIDECVSFPDGDHDDQVDTASLGFNKIFNPKKRAGTFGRNSGEVAMVPNHIANPLRKETFDELTTLSGLVIPDTSLVIPTKRKVSIVWGRK